MIVSDKPVDATEGDGIKRYEELGLHPNFDWRNMTSGFFATINGLPTYKFKAVGLFTKRVVEYGDRTEYTLFSPSGHETFINTSPASNMWVPGSSKSYTVGIELHVRRPCLNNICTHLQQRSPSILSIISPLVYKLYMGENTIYPSDRVLPLVVPSESSEGLISIKNLPLTEFRANMESTRRYQKCYL